MYWLLNCIHFGFLKCHDILIDYATLHFSQHNLSGFDVVDVVHAFQLLDEPAIKLFLPSGTSICTFKPGLDIHSVGLISIFLVLLHSG